MKEASKKPIVSIVLPVYNGEKYLSEAINSCIKQSFNDFELIIVDDKSTDKSLGIASAWEAKDPRIKVVQNSKNEKLPASLNIGFKQAHGEYFTWTSDDNILEPDFLKILVTGIEQTGADIVYSDYVLIDENGQKIKLSHAGSPDKVVFSGIGASFLYRRGVQTILKGYDTSLFLLEDYDFWVRGFLKGFRFAHLNNAPYRYRQHGSSLSKLRKKQIESKTATYRFKLRKKIKLNNTDSVAFRTKLLKQNRKGLSVPQIIILVIEVLLRDPSQLFKNISKTQTKKLSDGSFKVVHVSTAFYPLAASARLVVAQRLSGLDATALLQGHGQINFPYFKNTLTSYQNACRVLSLSKKKILTKYKRLKNFLLKTKISSRPWNDGLYGEPIHNTVKVLNPIIVHLHWTASGFPAIKYLHKINKPIVWTFHDVWPITAGHHCDWECTSCETDGKNCSQFNQSPSLAKSSESIWEYKKRYFQKINNLTIVTPSVWLRDKVRQHPFFYNRKVVAIPNCLNLNQFKPEDKFAARKQLNLPLNKKIVLFSSDGGTNVEYKGYPLLIEALKKVENLTDIHLVVIGPATESDKTAVPCSATFLGHIDNKGALIKTYNAADVFIGPSIQDNFPNVFIEAMACGIPSVGFSVGGIPEIVRHQERGYIAKNFDTTDLARGITWVLADPERYKVLCKNSRKFAEENLSFFSVAKQHSQLYKEILNDNENASK